MDTTSPHAAANNSRRGTSAAVGGDVPAPAAAAPDLLEALRRAGFRRTLRDDLEDFIADCRERPRFAAACALLGVAAGALAVIVPCLIIAWVQS